MAHRVLDKQRECIEDLVRTHGRTAVLDAISDPDAWIKMDGWSLLTKGFELDEERQMEIVEAVIVFVEGLE